MKRFKKITAICSAAAMSLSLAVSSFAALPSDAVDSPNAEAIETLGALKIMVGDAESGLFRPGDSIRRSEFAKIAVIAMGLNDVAESAKHKTKFPDVVEDHWANGYINVASEQGIVIGDDEGNFRPDDTISYAEAMAILVRAIGHDPVAETKGGFPTGYLVVGSQQGVSKNATAGADDATKRALAAQMVFNSLTIDMMEQTGFGNDKKYEIVDKTLLKDRLDVTKGYGQITATSTTSISGTSSLRDDEIRIKDIENGEDVFTLSDTSYAEEAKNLLGFNVVYYVKEMPNGDKELILARAEENKNSSIEVTAENIEEIKEENGKLTLSYWLDKENDRKPQEADIKDGAQFIWNGKSESIENIADMIPKAGYIRLLDTDRDDKHDIVFITSFENYVVEEVNTNSNRITDKYGKPSLVLDPKDKDLTFHIYRAGERIEIADLNEWDVLSVAKSKDAKLYNIYAVSNKVTGKITEISDDKYYIDGEEYKIAANYTEQIKLQDEGTFYLDIEGKIAAVDTSSTLSDNYAYLVSAALSSSIDQTLEMKLFTMKGETLKVNTGDKVKVNNATNQTPAQALEALKKDDAVQSQLITYETNSKGEVTKINLAADKTTTGAIDKNNFTLNRKGTYKYKKASKKLGDVNVNDQTVVFNIPEGKTDASDFSIQKIDLFDDESNYDVSIFDMTEDLTAKVVIVTNSAGAATAESSIAVVDKIATVTNEDGEFVDKLYAYQDGKQVSYMADSEDVLIKAVRSRDSKKVVRGDVIQLKLNAAGEIENIRLLFDSEAADTEFEMTPVTDLEIVYGKVVKKFPTSINVSVNDGAVKNYNISGVTVYEFDSTKNTNAIKVVEPGDIAQYDEVDPSRVMIRIYKDEVKEIVIVK